MVELPRANLVTSIELTPALLSKIEECVERCVSMSLPRIVEQRIAELEIDKIIEEKIIEMHEDDREFDIEELKQKINTSTLSKIERNYLKRKILESLTVEFEEMEEGIYLGISTDGEIITRANGRNALLLQLESLDIAPNKIFLHRIGKPFIGRI